MKALNTVRALHIIFLIGSCGIVERQKEKSELDMSSDDHIVDLL